MLQTSFRLQPYRGRATRFACPSCKKQGQFTRYVDVSTGELLPDHVGRCNREVSCGYHFSPKQYFENTISELEPKQQKRKTAKRKKPAITHVNAVIESNQAKTPTEPMLSEVQLATSYIDFSLFKRSVSSVKALEGNCFIQFLLSLFGYNITNDLINRFFIGCASKWKGSTVFWQMDSNCKVRTGRIMLYNPITGKRVKEPFNHVNWVHSELQRAKIIKDFNLSQCFFGEHQFLFDKSNKPVAIVESEKTAILSSVFLPDYIWLAAGGIHGLNPEKCKILSGKKVLLVPDLKAFHLWQKHANEIKTHVQCQIMVSDLLEKNATPTDRDKGLDLADYLIKKDAQYGWALSENDYPLFWDYNEAS